MLATLPLCTAMLMDWNKKLVARLSLLWSVILLPMSLMNLRPFGPHGPRVSLVLLNGLWKLDSVPVPTLESWPDRFFPKTPKPVVEWLTWSWSFPRTPSEAPSSAPSSSPFLVVWSQMPAVWENWYDRCQLWRLRFCQPCQRCRSRFCCLLAYTLSEP